MWFYLVYVQTREIIFDDKRLNILIDDFVIGSTEADILLVCLQNCVVKPKCLSVNFHKRQKKCNLLNMSLSNDDCYGDEVIQEFSEWEYVGSKQVRIFIKIVFIEKLFFFIICLLLYLC